MEGGLFLIFGFDIPIGSYEAGAHVVVELQNNICCLDRCEGFDKVSGVKADLQFSSSFADFDFLLGAAPVRLLAVEGQDSLCDSKADSSAAIWGEKGDSAQGFEEFNPRHAADNFRLFGDNLAVVGKGPFDQEAGKGLVAGSEEGVSILESEEHLGVLLLIESFL